MVEIEIQMQILEHFIELISQFFRNSRCRMREIMNLLGIQEKYQKK